MKVTTTSGKTYTAWPRLVHRGGTPTPPGGLGFMCVECGERIVYAVSYYRVYISSKHGHKVFGALHARHVTAGGEH